MVKPYARPFCVLIDSIRPPDRTTAAPSRGGAEVAGGAANGGKIRLR